MAEEKKEGMVPIVPGPELDRVNEAMAEMVSEIAANFDTLMRLFARVAAYNQALVEYGKMIKIDLEEQEAIDEDQDAQESAA